MHVFPSLLLNNGSCTASSPNPTTVSKYKVGPDWEALNLIDFLNTWQFMCNVISPHVALMICRARGFLVMIYTVGSGEMIKAAIMKHKVCVCFLPGEKARQMITARLFAWCKDKNVVAWKAPSKPIELINWEAKKSGQSLVRPGNGDINPDPKKPKTDPDPTPNPDPTKLPSPTKTLQIPTPRIAGFGTNAL